MNRCCESAIRKCADIVLQSMPHPLSVINSKRTSKTVEEKMTFFVSMMFRVKDDIMYQIPAERIRIDENRARERKKRKRRLSARLQK